MERRDWMTTVSDARCHTRRFGKCDILTQNPFGESISLAWVTMYYVNRWHISVLHNVQCYWCIVPVETYWQHVQQQPHLCLPHDLSVMQMRCQMLSYVFLIHKEIMSSHMFASRKFYSDVSLKTFVYARSNFWQINIFAVLSQYSKDRKSVV